MSERYVLKHPAKRFFVSCLDAAGSLYRRLHPAPEKEFDRAEIKKILLIRLDHLGDAIMTRPAIDAVRAAFPEANIDLLISSDNAVLYAPEPRLNIIAVDHHWFSRTSTVLQQCVEMEDLVPMLRRERYDLGIDFRGDLRHIILMTLAGIPERIGYGITGGGFLLTREGVFDPSLHQVDLNMRLLEKIGISSQPFRRPFLTPAPLSRHSALFEKKNALRIVIHAGAGLPEKKWPQENFQELIIRLFQQYPQVQIFLIGTREERNSFAILEEEERLIDLRGKTKIEELPAFFEKMHFYIGNDSGPAHLAAFQGLSGILLFSGLNNARIWRPWSEKFVILQHTSACVPDESGICGNDCIRQISVDQVFNEIQKKLAAPAFSESTAKS